MFNTFWRWISGQSAPARPRAEVRIVKEEGFPVALVYEVSVSAPSDGDVVTRRLTLRVNGEEAGVIDTPGSTIKFGGLKFNEGDEVDMRLVDIDDAGNQSPPAVFSFTAADTIAPAIPGGFGAVPVSEIMVMVTPATVTTDAEGHSKVDGKKGEGTKVAPSTENGPASFKADGKRSDDRRPMPGYEPGTDETDAPESGRQRKS